MEFPAYSVWGCGSEGATLSQQHTWVRVARAEQARDTNGAVFWMVGHLLPHPTPSALPCPACCEPVLGCGRFHPPGTQCVAACVQSKARLPPLPLILSVPPSLNPCKSHFGILFIVFIALIAFRECLVYLLFVSKRAGSLPVSSLLHF